MRFVPLSEIEGPTYRFVPLETSQPAEPPAAPATPPVAAVAPERPALEPMAGTMAGFELPEPTEPAPVAPVAAPEKPAPYKSRIEALDDAVNFIEEGADQKQVFDAFKQLGLTQEEIIRHGQKRGSEFFQVQPAGPGVPSVEPTGRMTSFEPGVLQQSADYFKRAKTSLSDQATSFMLSTGAIIPDNILDTYVNTKKAQGDTRPDSVIRDEARADAAANLIRRNARDRAAAAPNESIQRGMEEIGSAETYGDAAKAMLRNPGTTLSMLVESLLVTTPSLAATLVLAPAGVPARVATAFVSSGAMEYASVMNDVLQDKGVDLTNAEQVSKALRDPKILDEMKEKGAKRGLIVGGFDAISMGLAGRFLRPANELIAAGKLTGQAARNATISAWSKELAMQMALGAGGEFAAQQATGDNRPADVILEGLAEGLTAPLDVRATLRQAQAITPEAQIARAIEAGVAETEFTPEGIRREGAAAAAGIRPTTIAELARALPEPPSTAPAEPSIGEVAPPAGRAEPTIGEVAQAVEKAEPTISGGVPVVAARTEPRLGPPEEGGVPAGVTEPFSVPQGFRYAVTQSPAYEGIEPLSIEDADFELEALQITAQKGRLTPGQFAASEIGKRLDTSQIMVINQGLRTDPVGTINALRSAVSEAPPTAPRPPSAGETVTPPPQAPASEAPKPTPPAPPARPPITPVPGMPTGEEIEEPEVTPVTPAAKPPEEAVTPAAQITSFTTAKGSTYEVTPEGQTIRTKRSEGKGQGETYPPHTALYVQLGDHMEILSDLQSGMGGNAVRLGYVADNKFVPIQTIADLPKDAQPTVGIFNRKTGAVVNLYKADTTPAEGLHPVEKLYTPDGQSSTHIGNQIVSVQRVTPVTVTEEVTEPVTKVTPAFKPTEAAARLPETPTVAPITKPRDFEPATVDLESAGMPTVEVPLTQLKLSEDVPQFKIGATAEGVVEPLGGKFERTGVAPIQVWRRLDGSLEVISGRHRFDLAKRSGETTIPAQIHDEAKGFDRLQASILDAELNIRDGQGKVKDYVNYFKESGITKQDADARGLLARATGKRSFTIATQGSDELIAAVRADQIGDEAAFYIALNAPNDARLQGVGIKAIQDGKSMNTATNMMQAVKALAGETDTTLDMFGFDDSAIREAEEMAKIASQKQREIQTRLSAISGAAKNPALAKAEGIDVRDPEAIRRRIEELKQRKAAWDNWSTSPDLVAEIRQARGVEPPAPTIVEAPPAGPSLFDQVEDKIDTPAEEAAQIEDKTVRDKLKRIADNLGVRVFETSDSPSSNAEGYVNIPPEDKLVEGAQSADHVFAHELGHAVMQKRGMSYNRMPLKEVEKWIPGFAKLKDISKAYRPEMWKNPDPRMRRHANKPDEIIADALGAFFLGQASRADISPLIDGLKLNDFELGIKKFDRREAEDKMLAELRAEQEAKDLLTAPTPEDIRAKEEAAAKRAQEAAEAERKARADEQRGDFVLTGSERPADQAVARGQMELGEAPSTLTGRGIPLENVPPKQMGFGFDDTEATDFIARNNPVVAETLSKADQLPGAKKKLPPGRSPELAEAARQLKAGQITAAEFDALVNRYRPIAVYTEPLKPASDKQMYDALDAAKRDKINPSISDGYPVGLRLDIPAFNRAGVYVVTIHEKRTPSSPGKAIGYTSVAAVRNATFGVGNQQAALRIATGDAKDALQTIEGLYTPITPEEAYRRAEEALKSKDWVQVGIDPTRHSYFYDRKTTQPVLKADEIIQIGNMVLAKGVTYGNKSDFLFSPGIDRAEAEGLAVGTTREEQIKEYSALRRRLAGVVKKVAEGKVDISVQRNTTDMMQRSRELQAAIKASKPRIDTPEAFLAKALQEYDKGNIEKDVLDVIQAAYSKQPELLNGLLLSVRKEQGEAAGRFDPFRRVVFLFKQTSGVYNPATIRHELAHSLEQMMTPEQRVAVVQAWGKALARAIKQNPDNLHQRYFNAVLDFLENPSVRSFRKAQSLLPSYEMYQFINPSEYWAVNAEKLMAAQLGTAWDRFKKAVRQLFEGLKKVLGFDNRYEVHKVFSQVMGGSKERLNREALVDLVTDTDASAFVTLNNIEDADKILKKYNRPNTPQNDTTPLATFVNQQFKRGKEAFSDMVENPKEATVGAYNYVSDGLTRLRIENINFIAGVEKRDFERYGGQLRTSDKSVTASVALDNAIRGGNIAVEVISRGGIEYNNKFGNFVAVKTDMGMAGVYRAEKKLKDALGDQRGTDIINGYFEAKRSISIVDEFNERSKQLAAATSNYNVLKAAGGDPDAVAQAKAAMDAAREDVESIKKAMSSVTMSEEEMYEFAALEDTYPELRDMMDNWTAINQNLLQMWRQVGLLSQSRYETLSAIKDYVPWYRIMDDAADVHDPVQSTTRTFVNIGREKLFKRGKPVVRFDMRATAGQKEFNVPASSVVKIKVNDKAVDPKKVLLSPDGKIILDVDLQENDLVTFETVREIQNIVDNMTRNVMRMTMNGLRQFAQNRIVLEYATRNAKGKIQPYSTVDPAQNRFNWTSNGKKVVVEIADPLVAAAVYGLEPVNFGKALGAMFKASEMAANVLRRAITLSGAFQVKQVFKDAPTAAIVTGVRNPFALIGGVWKGFLTSLTNTDPVVDILKAAGIGGYMSPARTPEAELKRRMGIMNRNVFSFVIKGLDHIGDSADMAQRVAVYKRVLKETKNETQALYQAANVINYLRRGKAGYAQAIVKLVPFMGAYANATDVLLQTLMLRGLKGQTRAKLAGRLLATTGALSVVTLLYAMLAGADPEYDEVDDQTKLRNIFIPGTEIMLPMNTSAAYIFKVMPELLYMNLIRQSTESKMDERRLRRALGEAAKDMLLGPEPVPAGLKPLLEVGVNRSFYTGRDIVPENMQKLEPFMQFTASTSELAKKLGEYTNMSPMNIDHLVRGLFGSVGAMAQWASNSMAVAVGERPEPTRREAPVVGGFLRPELPRGREDLYYDFKKDVLEKYTTYDRLLKQENFDEAEKYFNKHAKLIEMHDYINEIDEGLQEVNQEIQRIALSKAKDLTPKERRSEITELQKIKRDVVDSVLDFRKDVYGLSSLVRQPAE